MNDAKLQALLEKLESGELTEVREILAEVIEVFECSTGTIHRLDEDAQLLELVVQQGIAESILEQVSRIPVGKGMAGLAAERRAPVSVCNLQSDDSGVARPGAKVTNMGGCIAVPAFQQEKLWGTLGIAKAEPHEFDAEEQEQLLRIGALLADVLG